MKQLGRLLKTTVIAGSLLMASNSHAHDLWDDCFDVLKEHGIVPENAVRTYEPLDDRFLPGDGGRSATLVVKYKASENSLGSLKGCWITDRLEINVLLTRALNQ